MAVPTGAQNNGGETQETLYLAETNPTGDGITKIYEVELDSGTGYANLTYKFDIPLDRAHIACSPDGSKIYAINRWVTGDSGPVGAVGCYDLSTNSWSSIGNSGLTGVILAACHPNGTFYVASKDTDSLYTISLTDATPTLQGIIKKDGTTTVDVKGADIAFTADGTLYLWSNASTMMGLYELTLPGSGGVVTATYKGEDVDDTFTFAGMAVRSNGTGDLVGSSNSEDPDHIYVISTTDGSLGDAYEMQLGGSSYDHGGGDMASPPCQCCTNVPEYPQIKVTQVPIPWQFWAVEDGTIIDLIRISPTWQDPPPGQPAGDGSIFIRRWFAVSQQPIPLRDLVWDTATDMPAPPLDWALYDDTGPVEVIVGTDLLLEILLDGSEAAVFVAYEVMTGPEGGPPGEVAGHFVNEAILERRSPQAIVQILVNLDIHNDTDYDVTNFELDFWGLDFNCEDIIEAIGFEVESGDSWGANCDYPLIVRPIDEFGTEVKWLQPDRPLEPCEWLHVGLVLDCAGFDCFNNPDDPIERATVQGYWTVTPIEVPVDIKPTSCPNPLNIKSKGVLPIAILGAETFAVTEIDPETVRLMGVAPLRWSIEDVATPFDGDIEDCYDCTTAGPDGFDDLTLKFNRQEIISAIGSVEDGECLVLTLTAELADGTVITGEDVVKIIKKGKNGNGPPLASGVQGKGKGL